MTQEEYDWMAACQQQQLLQAFLANGIVSRDDMTNASRYAFEAMEKSNDIVLKPGEYELVQDKLQIEEKK